MVHNHFLPNQISLRSDWHIISSAEVNYSIEEISRPDFVLTNWVSASLPSTVLAALVKSGKYRDPFFGLNLKNISSKPFKVAWWFRKSFSLSSGEMTQTTLLEFEGINYSANIWLNGKQIADSSRIRGTYRRFKFDVSNMIKEGENVILVAVLPPKPGDFSTGFVDWNPAPPDNNMGIFREVILRCCNYVSIVDPFVASRFYGKNFEEARLTVSTVLQNFSSKSIQGELSGEIDHISFKKSISIKAKEKKFILFSPEYFKELHIKHPKVWWPNHLGDPNLYQLKLKFENEQICYDRDAVRFGIREVEDYVNEGGHRGFKINGKKILIKSAGWSDDLFLSDTVDNLKTQIEYVKDMNLNSIRLEGIWGKDHTLYDLCDENGILMMVGWSCHWEHEQYLGKPVDNRYGGVFSPEDIELISKSWEDQVRWLRNHPSIFVWTVASDKVPHPDLERNYVKIFEKYDPTRPYLNSTGGIGSEQGIITDHLIISDISGSSRVKMLGPYAYTPPVYWYIDKELGGAYGFNTETGPGAQPPVLESIQKIIPKNHLWPIDDVWEYHCGRNEFNTLNRFQEALTNRYGKPKNIEEFDLKAQTMNYELIRPMFEAFQVNRDKATGIVHWMLNGAWPKMYWQLYDYFLKPNGAYYGTKKACSPLQLIYHYGDNSIYLVNDYLHNFNNLIGIIQIYDIHSKKILYKEIPVSIKSNVAVKLFQIPQLDNISTVYFLDLKLFNKNKNEISNNFYWLSLKKDLLDFDTPVQPWPYYTPSKNFADYTMLNQLEKSGITVEIIDNFSRRGQIARFVISNPTEKISFFIYLNLVSAETKKSVIPAIWSDNYVSLLPGESKNISVSVSHKVKNINLICTGWNLREVRKAL